MLSCPAAGSSGSAGVVAGAGFERPRHPRHDRIIGGPQPSGIADEESIEYLFPVRQNAALVENPVLLRPREHKPVRAMVAIGDLRSLKRPCGRGLDLGQALLQ